MNAPIYILTNCVGGFRATVLKIEMTVKFMMNKTCKLSNKGRLLPWPRVLGPPVAVALDSAEASPGVRAGSSGALLLGRMGNPCQEETWLPVEGKQYSRDVARKSLVPGISQSVGG